VEIRACRFLIADLTHANNGAYWEAGFAEGLGKPVTYTCKKSEFAKASHFDTNHHLTVLWEIPEPPADSSLTTSNSHSTQLSAKSVYHTESAPH
jgi:nucleoside 2-deoxyribosyltransferase